MASFWKAVRFAFGLKKYSKYVGWYFRGVGDEIKAKVIGDAEMTMYSDDATLLEKCKPWEQHLTKDAINELNKSVRNNDYSAAREAVRTGATPTAAPWCIDALLRVSVLLCTHAPTILIEASPIAHVYKK